MRLVLNFTGMILLARLVAPNEFGVFAVASGITLLVAYLSEIGTSWALIQRSDVTPHHVGTALTQAAVLSLSVASIIFVSSPWIAGLMRMEDLGDPLRLMCVVIPLQASAGVPRALLKRRLHFSRIVGIELVAALVGLILGVSHASVYHSVNSLILQGLVYQLIVATALWWQTPRQLVGRPTTAAFKSLVRFVSGQTAYEALTMLSKSLDTFLIGRFLGSASLGIYSRAFAFVFTPVGQIYTALGSVAFSAMSRHQKNSREVARIHTALFTLSAWFLGAPLIILAFATEPLVLVLLGDRWLPSASIMSIFCVAGAVQVLYANVLWAIQATGRLAIQMKAGMVLIAVNVTMFIVGVATSKLAMFASAYTVSSSVALAYSIWRLSREIGTALKRYTEAVVACAVAVALGGAVSVASRVGGTSPGEGLIWAVVALISLLALGIWTCRERLEEMLGRKIIDRKAS